MTNEPGLEPHLLPRERELMEKEMRQASSYLEFGTGGSTVLASRCGIGRIVSIDTNEAWLRRAAKELGPHASNVEFIHCDIGPTSDWGFPATEDGVKQWPEFFVRPWNAFLSRGELPELIYIDARFRLACALYSILALNLNRRGFFRASSRIMIYDYPSRPNYHLVEEHAVIVDRMNELVVLEPKRKVQSSRLLAQLFACQFDAR